MWQGNDETVYFIDIETVLSKLIPGVRLTSDGNDI